MAMATVLLILVVVLVLAALVFGVVSLLSGDDPGLEAAEPDGRAVALPNNRSLTEADLKSVRFDLAWRGYRMSQVDRVLRRTAYDVGYKDEMIAVLEAEVQALREGRAEDAELLRKARESAANPSPIASGEPADGVIELNAGDDESVADRAGSSKDGRATVTAGRALDDTVAGLPDFDTDASLVPSSSAGDTRIEPGSVDSALSGAGLSDEEIAAEEARLEAARQEAATPGRIAGRAPHSTKYAKRPSRSSSKASNGTGKPTDAVPAEPARTDPARVDAPRHESPRSESDRSESARNEPAGESAPVEDVSGPGAASVPVESAGPATLLDQEAVAKPEATDPPADRSAHA